MAAEAEQGGERTEDPSPKRLQDARERGQVPRSRELTTFATMVGGSAMLVAIGSSLAACLSKILRHGLAIDPRSLGEQDAMLSSLGEAAISAVTVLLPMFGALIGVVILTTLALGGWNFSMQAMVPDFTRLSPLAGAKRLFGLRGVSELGKALLKCAVVGGVCVAIVYLNKEIPAGLYAAVAQVLSYIFRVRKLNPTIAARVARPNPQVGAEFDDA